MRTESVMDALLWIVYIPWMLMVNAVRKSEYGFNRFTQSRHTHTHARRNVTSNATKV